MAASPVSLVVVVDRCQSLKPGMVSLMLRIATVDSKRDTAVCVHIPVDSSAAEMSTAIETAITAYCTTTGLVVVPKSTLIVGEPNWRTK